MSPLTASRIALLGAALLTVPAAAQPGGDVLYELTSPGPQPLGAYGGSIAALADQDGDGVADLVVGADEEDGAELDAGRAYVYSGATGALLHTLASPNPAFGGVFGRAVAGTGGLFNDVLVGAPFEADEGAGSVGRAYVFSGGALVFTLEMPTPESLANFGQSVADAGDVDGDGIHDYLVGAPGAAGGQGRAYVYSGATGALVRTLAPTGAVAGAAFGGAVANVGDLNGLGAPEHLVGAPLDGGSEEGKAYLFDGDTGLILRVIESPAPEADGAFGADVAALGAFGTDPEPYYAVAAVGEGGGGVEAGRVHLFQGATGTFRRTLASPTPEDLGRFGAAVAGLWGPAGTRGEAEVAVLVGAYGEAGGGVADGGHVHLFRLDGTPAATFASSAPETGGAFGTALAGLGDLDGDAVPDFAVGARFEDVPGALDGGRVSVRSFAAAVPNEPGAEAPSAFALHAPAPNPARGATRIAFDLDRPGRVRLAVYDVLGREVAVLTEGERAAGRHEAAFEVSSLPAGTYLVRLEAGGRTLVRALTHTR